MSATVCLAAKTLHYLEGGGHLWMYINWALGLRACGCQVTWLEAVPRHTPPHRVQASVAVLRGHLMRYGLGESLAICSTAEGPLSREASAGCLDADAAAEADLLLNLAYDLPAPVVDRFRRAVLVDIDPGLLQIWMSRKQLRIARHDHYFTTGETVGRPLARFPDAGLTWQYTPPCVALQSWPPYRAPADAPFTTVSQWYTDEWVEDAQGLFSNDKRTGFLPFLDLPRHTDQSLELALCLTWSNETERMILRHEEATLRERGWRVRQAHDAVSTPWDYQRYIQQSRGEFSCVKPSCVRLQNAWISDRTLCYLASAKPAVVQHTGPSSFLPESAGLFRFRTVEEAARCLELAVADYERHCRLARALAEEHFDAQRVVGRVLEQTVA